MLELLAEVLCVQAKLFNHHFFLNIWQFNTKLTLHFSFYLTNILNLYSRDKDLSSEGLRFQR